MLGRLGCEHDEEAPGKALDNLTPDEVAWQNLSQEMEKEGMEGQKGQN